MLATLEYVFTDPLGRRCCRWGHPWTESNRRIDPAGVWHCRLCSRESERRSEERRRRGLQAKRDGLVMQRAPQPEAQPAIVPWKLVALPASQAHLRGEAAVRLVVRAFVWRCGHEPTVVLVAPENRCQLGDVVVRERRAGEPVVTATSFGMR